VASGTLRRLQEAALLGFSERGYHGVSIRELADAAGIRVSSIYSHINAKEDLLLELMLIGHDEHRHVLLQALEGTGEDPRAQMPALVHAHVTLHATYPLLTRVCNRELHALSAPNAERVMQVRQESVELLLQPIERGVALGCFHCDEPALAAAAIGGMGIRVAEWFDPHGDVTVEAVARSYAEYSLKLLA
jgi:AcrR family transcriptional regulator